MSAPSGRPGTTVLVSCVSSKASRSAPASALYRSSWFMKARHWAQAHAERWYILSAKHGLVAPDQVLAPYVRSLRDLSRDERQMWADDVLLSVNACVPRATEIVILAGKAYRDLIESGLCESGYTVVVPMAGLGIGQQLAWLSIDHDR